MTDMEKRRERLLELLDTALAYVDDNPIHESYTSRIVVNYLNSIDKINQIIRSEKYE